MNPYNPYIKTACGFEESLEHCDYVILVKEIKSYCIAHINDSDLINTESIILEMIGKHEEVESDASENS